MKKRFISVMFILVMVLALFTTPSPVSAAEKTTTINAGTITLEISDVYAIDSKSQYVTEGYVTTYCVVVPANAKVKCIRADLSINEYLIWPYNDIVFKGGPMYPDVERSCDYDDALSVAFGKGTTVALVKNNEYSFHGGENERYFNVRVFAVDPDTLVQFGGPKPPKKPTPPASAVTASPSKTDFVVKGKGRNTVMDAPK
jgi:hypothetical protein